VILESGRGFTRDGNIKPSFATAGVNALTVGLNNKPIVATGAAVSGALLAGSVAMIYEWGVVKKNDINLYPPKIRSYMISATIKDEGRIYPNEEWGYGRFSFGRLIENLERISVSKKIDRYHELENLRNFESARNYIIDGTIRQQNVVYPTLEVGYGQLGIEKLFTSLLQSPEKSNKEIEVERLGKEVLEEKGLYVRLPVEICEKLRIH